MDESQRGLNKAKKGPMLLNVGKSGSIGSMWDKRGQLMVSQPYLNERPSVHYISPYTTYLRLSFTAIYRFPQLSFCFPRYGTDVDLLEEAALLQISGATGSYFTKWTII